MGDTGMFDFREIERCYMVCGGVDGIYDDPDNKEMAIVCRNGVVMMIPKEVFNHPSLSNASSGCKAAKKRKKKSRK